jgi:hypothetical protein
MTAAGTQDEKDHLGSLVEHETVLSRSEVVDGIGMDALLPGCPGRILAPATACAVGDQPCAEEDRDVPVAHRARPSTPVPAVARETAAAARGAM